ncbi:MAG: glycosyltransferase family 2 protein, partial [Eubacterium sp.]
MKTLVIIPAYNEEESLVKVINKLRKVDLNFDYIIIDDCSTDSTEKICSENNYNYIHLPVNLGIGGGVQTGYQYAKENNYDIAIQMDGDGQHNPEDIKVLIQPLLDKKVEMVIG